MDTNFSLLGVSIILNPFRHNCFLQKLEQTVGSVMKVLALCILWRCSNIRYTFCTYRGHCSCLCENITGVWVDLEVLL